MTCLILYTETDTCICVLCRSELIQLVAVTHKRVESSYRELIEQEIQNYQRRSVHLQTFTSQTHHVIHHKLTYDLYIFTFTYSWYKVTEHLTEKNIPAFMPGTKVTHK